MSFLNNCFAHEANLRLLFGTTPTASDGKEVQNGDCIESCPQGVSAKLVWEQEGNTDLSRLLVWDADAPCSENDNDNDNDENQVYIHFAGGQATSDLEDTTTPMTASAGNTIHTYRAAWFDTLPVPTGTTGCHPLSVDTVQGCHHMKEWKVARYETSCPDHDLDE